MSDELWQRSAADIAAAVREREVSCLEVTRAHLEHMDRVNGALNAMTVRLADAALAAAADADAALARGEPAGILQGVPVTIKENVDQAGQATTNGVADFANVIAASDSPVVANLRNAGAIVIGRTNTPEFSLRWFTDNVLRGPTQNPWNADLTPGGSSGGAAAAVAAGIGALAHGNDLGGSLRYPAYCCGVSSIRPSLGRVPAYNASALEERSPAMQLMSVQGPLARRIGDVRLALSAMSGKSRQDPWWVEGPAASTSTQSQPRVAVCRDLPAHPAVTAAVDSAARYLDEAGYAVESVALPNVAEIARAWCALLTCEIRTILLPAISEHGSGDVRHVLELFLDACDPLDLEGYMRTLADRTRLIRRWAAFMEGFPLVLAPVSLEPPMPVNDDLTSAERMAEILSAQQTQYMVNFLGLPAAAVPTGLVDGIPMGVQLIGRRFEEAACLDAAEVIENAVGVLALKLDLESGVPG